MKSFSKQMKDVLSWTLVLLAGLGASVWLAGCDRGNNTSNAVQNKTLYTCGMHPQVIQDHPGLCPICEMKLTPIPKQNAGTNVTSATETPGEDSQTIAVDPVTVQNMGIRTAVVKRGPLRRIIRTVGAIDYNETTLADVTTKFKGWVEKLYVDSMGRQVHSGEPLFEVYSPDLYSAQREYLLAIQGGTNTEGAASLQTSALNKLRFFDVSPEQIRELERRREPRKTLKLGAPQDGFVVEKMVVEGQMVEPGMKLYRLADLSLVWVQAQIYEQDLAYLHLGQEATVRLSYLPDREFRGRVTYIYPNIDEKTRTARVRMEFHNPGYFLKPGMFATVEVASELDAATLLVPEMAVLRSGQRNTVFVDLGGGKFEPRLITLGLQAENDMYQVLRGLKEGERIVTSGQFMLDSESQLQEAIHKMEEPGKSGETSPETTSSANGASSNVSASDITNASATNAANAVKYICPMPEHISIQYDHPGKCPVCGMTLVPVTEATLAKLQPGGKLLYFTCPMPEHADVRTDKPGKCPKCGMTLIPVTETSPPSSPTNDASPSHLQH